MAEEPSLAEASLRLMQEGSTIRRSKRCSGFCDGDRILDLARQGLEESRRAIRALRTGPVETLGLDGALSAIVQSFQERTSTWPFVHSRVYYVRATPWPLDFLGGFEAL